MSKIFSYIPSSYIAGTAYTPLPNLASADFDVTRADEAVRTNSDGVLEEMGANVPRVDYSQGGCPTLLCEGAATNLFLWSEDFSNVFWSKFRANIVADAIASPELGFPITADKITETADSGDHVFGNSALTLVDGNKYYATCFAKKGERTWFNLYDATGGDAAFFDLENGVVGTVQNGVGTIEEIPNSNGWYRCCFEFTQSGTTGRVFAGTALSDGVRSYLGDGSSGLYVWGFDLKDEKSSYIKSDASNGTRAADVIDGAQADFDDNIGVIEIDMQALANSGTDRSISINDGTSAERIEIRLGSTDNNIECYFVHLSSFNNLSYNVKDATEMNNVKILYNGTTAKLKINDVQVDQREDREVSVGLSTCDFKIGAASNLFEGYLQQFNVYSDTSAFASTATTFNAMATTAKYDLK